MERRFEVRLEELLEDAVLDPRVPEGMLDRLERFVEPFGAYLMSSEQREHVWEYVAGLFSDVKRKNAICSPCRRTPWCVICRHSPRRTAVAVVALRFLSRGWIAGG